MSTDGIFPKSKAVSQLMNVFDAAAFSHDVHALAAKRARDPLLGAVLRRAAEQRRLLRDEIFDALAGLDVLPAPADPLQMTFDGWSDIELCRWCGCADEILDEAGDGCALPLHLQEVIDGVHTFIRFGRERISAWEHILLRGVPDEPSAPIVHVDVLLCGVNPEIATALARDGVSASLVSGPGEALGRLGLDPTTLLVTTAAQQRALEVAIEGVDAVGVSERILGLSEAPVRELADRILAVLRRHTTPRVLIVEDDADLRALLHATFLRQGFRVEDACDGADALKKLDPNGNEVVLLDLMMPRLSGLGFLRELNAAATKPPQVVVYSAFVEPIEESYPNVSAVLRKTADMSLVTAVVRRSMERLA
jgi:CheY-like chemotaxis protein